MNVVEKTPVLFISHGSPSILLAGDPILDMWREQLAGMRKPDRVLLVSAHWETDAPVLGGNRKQQVIHDFHGFPAALYRYRYPAPGDAGFAAALAHDLGFELDQERGLDHAAWVPLCVLFPEADIPVTQLSVSPALGCEAHMELGARLADLREQNVLIIASGVIVHNLSRLDWKQEHAGPERWASQFLQAFLHAVETADLAALLKPYRFPQATLALPGIEHYLPFLVALGAAAGDRPCLFAKAWRYANLSQHSFVFRS